MEQAYFLPVGAAAGAAVGAAAGVTASPAGEYIPPGAHLSASELFPPVSSLGGCKAECVRVLDQHS